MSLTAPHTRVRPDAAAAAFLFVIYAVTLARGVTFWDAGEFLAAVHSLGIPHPPGTPLFILVARVWSMLAAPIVGFTIAVNLFSALCTAAGFGLVANLFWRWTGCRIGAFCSAVTAGLMSTVWLNATETEVYACSLFASLLILWCANKASVTGDRRWIVLVAYLCGLGWSLHLTALLSIPAALVLLAPRIRALRSIDFALMPIVAVLGASVVVFMLIRAQHDPAINQGNPANIRALIDAVQRHQYDVAPLWPRRAPLWLQFGNVFEYVDWQVALGLAPDPPPSWLRTPFTLAFVALGVYGSAHHRKVDFRSWCAWLVFLVTTSICVVLYLNSHAGASYGIGVLAPGAVHEARDRDYFFTWAFVAWGAWAGFGAATLVRTAAARVSHSTSHRKVTAPLAVCVALLPCVLNWRAITSERSDEQHRAEREAIDMLKSAPPRAVFLAIGDNDTYPLWYLQQVQGFRRDVIVVTQPLLPPTWYRAELLRRHHLLDSASVREWRGIPSTVAEIRAHAAEQGRPVVESPLTHRRAGL